MLTCIYGDKGLAIDSGPCGHAKRSQLPRFGRWIVAIGLFVAFAVYSPTAEAQVTLGMEAFLNSPPEVVEGKRIGLVTNHSAIDSQGRHLAKLMAERSNIKLAALFGPEHGIYGLADAGDDVASTIDSATQVPVYSLFHNCGTHKPSPEQLDNVDVMVFDVQDVGARPYTYIYAMALTMEAAAEKGIPYVVLDRPNPISGAIVEGDLLDTKFASAVGKYPIPVRHGMTTGELAKLFTDRFKIGVDLTVVPLSGWTREMFFDQTGLQWVKPSTAMLHLTTALHYPGTVFIEGTNLSEGRGTDSPFELVGAPWMNADEIARTMNNLGLSGVRFEATTFTPSEIARKYKTTQCQGIRLVITDRDSYRPVRTTLLLIDEIRKLHTDKFQWEPIFDKLAGTDRLRLAIEGGNLSALLNEWDSAAQEFTECRKPYLLYE